MDSPDRLPRHSIAVVAERTGLTQDVLRVWERRYAAVTPSRSAGGQRLYSDADVARLRLLNITSRAGRPIGQLATLSNESLSALAEEDAAARRANPAPPASDNRETLASEILKDAIAHARELESGLLANQLRRAAASLGVTEFIDLVATPLMHAIGDQWASGWLSIAQEHLATAVLRDILLDIMRSFANPADAERIVVATPAGERHEIGAAMVGASAAAAGWNVIYIGADLPAADIITAARTASANVVALSVIYAEYPTKIAAEIRAVRETLPAEIRVLLGGAGADALSASLASTGVEVGGMQALFSKR